MGQQVKIGLALSGGGSRAIAFHLGCLKALNELKILDKVDLISSVSGGSVIAAMYAYSDCTFEEFEGRVRSRLRKGFLRGIIRYTLLSSETPKIIWTIMTAGLLTALGKLIGVAGGLLAVLGFKTASFSLLRSPFRRKASRTTAFERFLRKTIFGNIRMGNVKRDGVNVVINATELQTGTAFRFGSKESGCWRFGLLEGDDPLVSKAVAASAAFPALLPSFDLLERFKKNGSSCQRRVIITDGGVYDNLGISCMLPGRDPQFSTNVFQVDYIICCSAGAGQSAGGVQPYTWGSRMVKSMTTIHSRTHSLSYDLLHRLSELGKTEPQRGIRGFILPYLGQKDESLPLIPDGFVSRDQTYDYPTDFSPMSLENIHLLSKRGEQLTRLLVEQYDFLS